MSPIYSQVAQKNIHTYAHVYMCIYIYTYIYRERGVCVCTCVKKEDVIKQTEININHG